MLACGWAGWGRRIAFNIWVFALTDHFLAEILLAFAIGFMLPIVLMCLMIKEDAPLLSGAGAYLLGVLAPARTVAHGSASKSSRVQRSRQRTTGLPPSHSTGNQA
jgi:hypothetical protein